MGDESEKKEISALMKASGKLASKDEETFKEIAGQLIESWGIERPQEIMLVNRMVSTWMKMRRVEELMGRYDLFFEELDKDGRIVGIKMNQLAYYLKHLEADFRNYYKVLQGKNQNTSTEGPVDFGEFLKDVKPVEKDG